MSAYNRKMLKKQSSSTSSHDADVAMEDLGYASFKVLHNSTVEAPFLFERDSGLENCRNAPNTTAQNRSQKSSFNSTQFQTPNSSNFNNSNFNSTINSSLWQQSLSLPAVSCVLLEVSEDEDGQSCKSPLLLSNQMQCAAKRRKSHYQQIAHHSSPKKSKKQLFPQPAEAPLCRTRYYDGCEHLDIVGMLSNTLPALECILANVSSHTLDVMTKVSERWAQAVYKSQRATERLQNHRFKMNLTKENKYRVKQGHLLSRSITNLVPLQPSNAIQKANKNNSYRNSPKDDNSQLVEQKQRIKCPRCGKSSKVFNTQTAEHTPQSHHIPSRTALSQTLPHTFCFSQPKVALPRFHSVDQITSTTDENSAAPTGSQSIGECTSVLCKFRFCVHCCSTPHPGVKCLVTELGTPSKIMMPSERVTPPKRNQRFDRKLSRKNSLKRLNF